MRKYRGEVTMLWSAKPSEVALTVLFDTYKEAKDKADVLAEHLRKTRDCRCVVNVKERRYVPYGKH